MNENDFISRCKGNVHYCSVKQQEESLEKSSRHHLSLTTITYIHLFVQSGPHSAAVQITINPFSLENYPKQTFFHSSCRYSLCCGKAPRDTVATTVKERVQKVYDVFYLPGYWDFSHDQYVTMDDFNTMHNISKESCLLATNSMLCEYIQSTYMVAPIPEGLVPSPAAHGASEPSLTSGCGRRNNRVNRTRSHHTRTDEDPLPANDNYDANNTQPIQSTTQGNSGHDEIQIQIMVKAAAKKVRRGLKNLKHEDTSTLPQLPYDPGNLYDKAKRFEELLWGQASQIETALGRAKWSRRFLASCFSMIRIDMGVECGADSQPITDRKRKEWQVAAEIINSVVNCLLKIWGWKAFLLYPALESTGYYFVRCSRLERKKRGDVVSGLVEILRHEVPTIAFPPVLLDPAFLIGCALDMDYNTVCAKLRLDAAPTVEINVGKLRWESQNFDCLTTGYKLQSEGEDRELENGRTDGTFPSRKRKADVEPESTPSQIKKSSTGAFLVGFNIPINHGYEKTPALNPKDDQFRQNVIPSLPGPRSSIPGREPTIDANPARFNNNPISIKALLNTAD